MKTLRRSVGESSEHPTPTWNTSMTGSCRRRCTRPSARVQRRWRTVSAAQRHENHLARLEAKHEKAVARHDLLLARREARYLAHHPNGIMPHDELELARHAPGQRERPAPVALRAISGLRERGRQRHLQPDGINGLVISGTNVGIQVKDSNNTGDFNSFAAAPERRHAGARQLADIRARRWACCRSAQLPTVAQLPQTLSITPMFNPILNSG